MQFQICGETFAVTVVDNLIRGGVLCDGHFEPAAKRILISSAAADRKRTLYHELRHAWTHVLGQRGIDPESDAIDVAAFADTVGEQLEKQGGEVALMAMRPPVTKPAEADGKGLILRDRMECSCGAFVMIGSIATGDPEFSHRFGHHVVERWMDCDACGAVTVWRETADEAGTPLGRLLPTPKVLRGAARVNWLRQSLCVH